MSTYPGILIRSNLGDVGAIPRTGSWTGCPDIIPYGQTPVNDPQATFGTATGTPTSYDKDPGVNITAMNVNYIYVRGKNLTNTPGTGQAYLFYSPSSIVLNPQQWIQNHIPQAALGQSPPPVMLPAAANSVGVVTAPFVWLNPQQPPDGQHYCLITMVGSAGESIQQIVAAANKVYDMASLGAWIANHGGTGWRNVVTVNTGAADFSTFTNYSQIGGDSTIQFQLNCTNLPAGSEVSFSAPVPTGTGPGYLPISLPRTKVPAPKDGGAVNPSFQVGMTTKVPAGYASTIFYQWYSNGFAKPEGFQMTLQAIVISNGVSDALAEHPVTFAQLVGNQAYHYNPEVGLVRGLKFFRAPYFRSAAFASNDDDPFGPPDVPTLPAATVGTHTTAAHSIP